MFGKMIAIEMVSCLVVFVVLVSVHGSSDDGEYVKQKRAYQGVSGLTPFPRTGRSDPDLFNWDNVNQNHINNDAYGSFEEYEEYPHMEVKRQGLIPFPRVGRSGPSKYLTKSAMMQGMKRGVPGSGNAMWFGPRLGRIQKRNSGAARDPSPAVMQENGVDVGVRRFVRETDELNDYDQVPENHFVVDTDAEDRRHRNPAYYPDPDLFDTIPQ